jgi:hypothetical protein
LCARYVMFLIWNLVNIIKIMIMMCNYELVTY